MEDEIPKEEGKKVITGTDMVMKSLKIFNGLKEKEKATIPNYEINKKFQKKFLKIYSKDNHNISILKKDEISTKEDKKTTIKKFPSIIEQIIIICEKRQIINSHLDYEDLKENYKKIMKDNEDKELIQFIENSFLLCNDKSPILRKIVKNPFSLAIFIEKISIWEYYVTNSTKKEKALIMRKLLYYIGKLSEKIYKEFIGIKEISEALYIFLLNDKLNKCNKNINLYDHQFYTLGTFLGYDHNGNNKDGEKEPYYREEMRALWLLQHKLLNIEKELNGTGYGFVFLKELKEICNIYNNASDILGPLFRECLVFIDSESFSFQYKNFYRIFWNFFVNYFIDDSFVMNFIIELKYIFGAYKQDDMVKFLHNLVLYRYNTFDILNKLKNEIEKLLGPEEIFDEKEKVQKMKNIDDVLKYIEGDEKEKKKKKKNKKKKKKKNEDNINNIKDDNNNDNCDDTDNSDAISTISVADSVLNSFKNDLIQETEFNTGNKIIPQLSPQFLNQFQ